jgi:hypothetical protein
MISDLSPFRSVTHIGVVGSFGLDMLFLEVGADAEHRSGASLTLATMTGDDGIGLAGHFDAQSAA